MLFNREVSVHMLARVLVFAVMSFLFLKFLFPPLLGLVLATYAGFMLMMAGAGLIFHAAFWLLAAGVVGAVFFKLLSMGKKR